MMMTPVLCAHVKRVGLTGSGLAVRGQVTTLDAGQGASDWRQQY